MRNGKILPPCPPLFAALTFYHVMPTGAAGCPHVVETISGTEAWRRLGIPLDRTPTAMRRTYKAIIRDIERGLYVTPDSWWTSRTGSYRLKLPS